MDAGPSGDDARTSAPPRARDDRGTASVPAPRVRAPIVLPSYDAIPELSDGRVALRRWTQRDAPVLVASTLDPEARRFRLFPDQLTDDEALRFIASSAASWQGDHHALWLAVTELDGGAVVGGVHLLAVSPEVARAQLGFWTLPGRQGHGIGTAAARLLADWAITVLGIARVQLETHVSNGASCRVAEKLGFALEAVLRDHRPFGDLRSDCLLYGRLATDRLGAASRLDPHVTRLRAAARSDRPAATVSLPDRQPTLGNGTITLRPWRDDDADLEACVAGCSDPETVRWLPLLPSPYTEHDGRGFLARATTGWDEDRDGHFAVVDAAGRHLGGARLRSVGDPAVAEIGYRVLPAARRRGVAMALTHILTRWALDDLGFARVQIRAERLNEASVGVARKAGFVYEGCLRGHELDRSGTRRDDLLFSLVRDDPRPAPIDGGAATRPRRALD